METRGKSLARDPSWSSVEEVQTRDVRGSAQCLSLTHRSGGGDFSLGRACAHHIPASVKRNTDTVHPKIEAELDGSRSCHHESSDGRCQLSAMPELKKLGEAGCTLYVRDSFRVTVVVTRCPH